MIVITSFSNRTFSLSKGDIFSLNVRDGTGCEVVLKEEITCDKVINWVATFRFATEDGVVAGFHLMGIFGVKDELPEEFSTAVHFKDLPRWKQENFVRSCGVKIKTG
jgi:hypothetical protein